MLLRPTLTHLLPLSLTHTRMQARTKNTDKSHFPHLRFLCSFSNGKYLHTFETWLKAMTDVPFLSVNFNECSRAGVKPPRSSASPRSKAWSTFNKFHWHILKHEAAHSRMPSLALDVTFLHLQHNFKTYKMCAIVNKQKDVRSQLLYASPASNAAFVKLTMLFEHFFLTMLLFIILCQVAVQQTLHLLHVIFFDKIGFFEFF